MSEVVSHPLARPTSDNASFDWRASPSSDPRRTAFANAAEGSSSEVIPAEVLTGAAADEEIENLLDRTRRGKAVAEIHVPFCETRCEGCGCWQNDYRELESSRYADAVVREMRLWSGEHAQSGTPIQALRIGGGNPTALEPVDILRILSNARRILPLANDCEIEFDARVHHFTEEKMEAALAGGVTRFLLPVRSFNTAVRRAAGRVEDAHAVVKTLERLLSYDEASVAIELNYGLPGQSLEVWESDLRTASSMNLDGLTLRAAGEPEFPAEAEKTFRAASDELLASEHALAFELLPGEGWEVRSALGWGRSERERSLYRSLAMGDADRLVFGSGARGRLFGREYLIEPELDKWLGAVYSGRRAVREVTLPKPYWRAAALLAQGIADGRFSITRTERAGGVMLGGILEPLLDNWRAAGLVSGRGDWIRLTEAGSFHQFRLAGAVRSYVENMTSELVELPYVSSVGQFPTVPLMAESDWRSAEASLAAAS